MSYLSDDFGFDDPPSPVSEDIFSTPADQGDLGDSDPFLENQEPFDEYPQEPPRNYYQELPEDPEVAKSRRTTILVVVVIIVIIVFLLILFLYLNLKKNKRDVEIPLKSVTIQNAEGEFWGLGHTSTILINTLPTASERRSIEELSIIPPVQGQSTNMVYVSYREKDPNTRWTITPDASQEGAFNITSNFDKLSGFLTLNTNEYGTLWPPAQKPQVPFPPGAPVGDYGEFTYVTTTPPGPQSRFSLIPAGSKTDQGFPFHIAVEKFPTFFLASISPPSWPENIKTESVADVYPYVHFMNQRKRLYIRAIPEVWYIK